MCELMFPKPTRKKKRKHHPAPIVDTVKGECFLCRLEGIRRQQYTEEHHVFYGGGLRKVSEENGFKVYLCRDHHKDGPRAVHNCRERVYADWVPSPDYVGPTVIIGTMCSSREFQFGITRTKNYKR